MSLKILILPTFIILEVIIAIGYIKPDIDEILAKRIEIQTAKESVAKLDATVANIRTVGQSVASRAETVNFVGKYYPQALDEERVVDMFNFLAQQSGVAVIKLDITPEEGERVADTVYNDALNSGKTPEEATLIAEAAAASAPKIYSAEVSVFGAYGGIKDFFSRIHHSDRLHTTDGFMIGHQKENQNGTAEETDADVQPGSLTGTLTAKFPYVGPQRTRDALNDPLFQSPTFNFKTAEQAITFVTAPLPTLESGEGGRQNPFE